jgi:hypothetical protein
MIRRGVTWVVWVMWMTWLLGMLETPGVNANCGGKCPSNQYADYCLNSFTPVCIQCAQSFNDPQKACRDEAASDSFAIGSLDSCKLISDSYDGEKCKAVITAWPGKDFVTNCALTSSSGFDSDNGCTTCGKLAKDWCGDIGMVMKECLYGEITTGIKGAELFYSVCELLEDIESNDL